MKKCSALFTALFLVLTSCSAQSENARPFKVDIRQVTAFSGPDFRGLLDSGTHIDNLRLSPDKKKIAFTLWNKFNEAYNNLGVANIDGSDAKLLVKDGVDVFVWLNDSEIIYRLCGKKYKDKLYAVNVKGIIRGHEENFDFSMQNEIPEIARTRIKEFLKARYKPHYGTLGGTAYYEVVNYAMSPDKSKIAFLIGGDDGHFAYWHPAWYVCSSSGRRITRIDPDDRQVSKYPVWLSASEFIYAKDARLWKAVIE